MKIPFSPPDITEAEIEQVAEALRSGWITTGPKTKELEREVADLYGTNRAVCLNSQTACAEMTLRLLGIHEGDEVITCAYALAKTQLGAWEYDIIGPWFKCNMTDVVAGIGLAQMKRYKGLLARRKEMRTKEI